MCIPHPLKKQINSISGSGEIESQNLYYVFCFLFALEIPLVIDICLFSFKEKCCSINKKKLEKNKGKIVISQDAHKGKNLGGDPPAIPPLGNL